MNLYLDTSIVLRVLLGQPDSLPAWGTWTTACTSEILGLEARRAIDRLRLDGALDDDHVANLQGALATIEQAIDAIRLTRLVLGRAALPMGTPVKTLDALHLASALLWRERRQTDLVFATHDAHQARAARALGFESIGHST